jgi:ribosomal protein L37E
MGDRTVPFDKDAICDSCGKKGAYDFMGDCYCSDCYSKIANLKEPKDDSTIEDGFGSVWSAWCPMCGRKSMHVVRLGDAQCNHCG